MRIRSLIFASVAVVYVLVGMQMLFSAPVLADACPNEQVRAESAVNPETEVSFSMGLPECRAYEMVTPVLKNGSPVGSSVGLLGLSSVGTVARIGSEGSTVLVEAKGIWPGGEQPGNDNLGTSSGSEGVQYRMARGESGWRFKPEMPVGLREFMRELLPSPADTNTNGIWGGAGLEPTEAEISGKTEPNFYLLEPDGAVVEVGPSVSRSGKAVEIAAAVGASADLSHILFSVAPSLYEYVGTGHSGEGSGAPTLVGVDNTGTPISQCGTEAGGYEGENDQRRSDETGEPGARSISEDGSSVFVTAKSKNCGGGTGPAVNEVFARIGDPGPGVESRSAVTVNVAGTSECATATFDSCNVTKAVRYWGASADGSKVFFTSEQSELVAGEPADSTNNLYECRLPGDSGAALTSVPPVNQCPDLVRVSVPVSGGAEVQSVAAVSQGGSHVYFVAKGVLTSEPDTSLPSGQQVAEQGENNLYVWEEPSSVHPHGRTTFIAPLSSAAFKLGEAQTTPSGDSLVFTSSADLLSGDTSTVSQVFLYEANTKALRWVSEGQGGSENGDSTAYSASLTSGEINQNHAQLGEGRRVISEDGSMVVFQSSAALTPQVHRGRYNVYLWRGGDLSLISDGTSAGTHHGGNAEGLVGIDASGQNVFFTTEAPLVAQDNDELSDLYDARVDGGFPAPKVTECSGEGCQGAFSVPLASLTPGSLSSGGSGNMTSLRSPSSPTTPKPKPKPPTRSEKLAQVLKACARDRAEKKRAQCEALARKRYGTQGKRKAVQPERRKGK